jgi:HEAT repeat protein
MFDRKTIVIVCAISCFAVASCFADGLKDNWNDFLHYTKIGRLDLAAGYARAVLDSNPDPLELLALSEQNPQGYQILVKVAQTTHDSELAELGGKILEIIEEGKFIRRADPKIITEEIKRLSGTSRGQLTSVKRLRNAGEYAVPYMIEALADDSRKAEWPNIIWALPQVGKDAIRPLVVALQTENVGVKAEIIKALGNIGYTQSLGYLKYVAENDTSSEMRFNAEQSIMGIDPAAVQAPASQLLYRLAESYYYHTESLAPAEQGSLSNVWFWDKQGQRLTREKVDSAYFNELMAMRSCEWALRAEPGFGGAIGLWLAAYFKAESTGLEMPNYFGSANPDAFVYATTAGAEYLHQALERALKDNDAYVALGAIEALAVTAGEESLFYRLGTTQPLVQALSFGNRAVRYSAAIAIASAGPRQEFPEKRLVAQILSQALAESDDAAAENSDLANPWVGQDYSLRAANAMLHLAQTRNPVIDLTQAQIALIKATRDKRPQIQALAAQILVYLSGADAQKAIAAMALTDDNPMEIRLLAFESLALSAKLNANQLDDAIISAIYSMIGSEQVETKLREAAAGAFGALNLPSEKVKNLILDQSKS